MLNPTQLTALKAYIEADPVLSLKPMNSDGDYEIATELNKLAPQDYFVWSSTVPTSNIFDAIVWANMTPSQAPDGTQSWLNKTMLCQSKQFNLQTILSGRETINATKANIRAGLQDALTGLPSKADGSVQPAGWGAVQQILSRKATLIEKILATGTGTVATPSTMSFEGYIDPNEVGNARK